MQSSVPHIVPARGEPALAVSRHTRNYNDGPDADDPDCVIEEEEHPVQHAKKPVRNYSSEDVAELFDIS